MGETIILKLSPTQLTFNSSKTYFCGNKNELIFPSTSKALYFLWYNMLELCEQIMSLA